MPKTHTRNISLKIQLFFLEQKDRSQSSSEYVYDKDQQQLQNPLFGRSDVKSVTREDAAPLK